MKIKVKLYSYLKDNRFPKADVQLQQPNTVDNLLEKLGILQHEIGAVYINGKEGTFVQVLAEGDNVSLLPLIGGG